MSAGAASLPHVLIVGGGFGGLRTAGELSGVRVRVTLIDRMNHHLFQPLLYQVATAGLSPADIAYPIRSALSGQPNAEVLLGEVSGVDLGGSQVTLSDGKRIDYDYLVLAAGARTNYFGNDAEWAPHALGLKDIDEALEIRRRVLLAFEAAEREADAGARKRLLTFVVIGGGPTGVEVAGALSELARFVLAADFRHIKTGDTRVVLVEAQDRLLPGGFSAKLADKAKLQLEELGVEVRLGVRVTDIDEQGVALGDERVEAATTLWTAGVKARSITTKLGVELDRAGRVIVNQDCSIPGFDNAFAIGDNARFVPEGSEDPLPGIAPVALQQASHVADAIAKKLRKAEVKPFKYLDKGLMATVGRSRAVVQSGRLRLSGLLAWWAWLVVHIWYLIGFRNRVAVLLNWFWAYITYKRGARLITGERAWDALPRLAHPSDPALHESAPAPAPAAASSENAQGV